MHLVGFNIEMLWFSLTVQSERQGVRAMPETLKVTISVFYS